MVNVDVRVAVRMSFERASQSGEVLDRFYELFLNSDPEVRRRFAHTNFDRQKKLLRQSLDAAIFSASGDRYAHAELDRIQATHGRACLDIPNHLYDLWRASLIQAVSENDPEFHRELATQWRAVLQPAIDYLTGKNGSSTSASPPDRLPG